MTDALPPQQPDTPAAGLPAGLAAIRLTTMRLAAPEPGLVVLTLDRPERLNAMRRN